MLVANPLLLNLFDNYSIAGMFVSLLAQALAKPPELPPIISVCNENIFAVFPNISTITQHSELDGF
jgi:hypothetical protein